jgi:hypothetical protein
MKYEIVNIGGGEDGDFWEEYKFNDVSELSELELNNISGLVWLSNCSFMEDEDIGYMEEEGFGVVKEMIDRMEGGWYMGERKEEFVEKYGEMSGIGWGIEYDDNCSVMLKGNWKELREEVKKEMIKREW